MKHFTVLLFALALAACGGSVPQAQTPPQTAVAPVAPPIAAVSDPWTVQGGIDQGTINRAYAVAVAKTVAIGRTPDPAKAALIRNITTIVAMPVAALNNGVSGFFADDLMPADKLAATKAQYPGSIVNGQLLLGGLTDPDTHPGTVTIYAVTDRAEPILEHEFLHWLWFVNWGAEVCRPPYSPVFVQNIVEHGIACDPFAH